MIESSLIVDESMVQSPPKTTSKSPKRLRTAFTPDQRKILELSFQRNNLPSSHELEDIAEKLGLKLKIVRTWFQNKRTQARKRLNKFPNRESLRSAGSNCQSVVPPNLSDSMKIVPPPNVSLNPIPTRLPFKITSAINQSPSVLQNRLWNPFLYESPRQVLHTPPAQPSSFNNISWTSYQWNSVSPHNTSISPEFPPATPGVNFNYPTYSHQDSYSYSPGTSPHAIPVNSYTNYSLDNYRPYSATSPCFTDNRYYPMPPTLQPDHYHSSKTEQAQLNLYHNTQPSNPGSLSPVNYHWNNDITTA